MAIANNNKFVVKHGLHTQNIDFVSPDTANIIQATMLDDDRLSFEGNSGQLFSITDDMTGTIFAVNDVSGVPSIEVDADGTVRIAETFGNILIGTNVDDGTTKLQIAGNVSISGTLTANGLTAGGDISFADNERLYFGDGNDASIWFDGNNLNISESSGTGNLYLRGADIIFANHTLSETYAQMYTNGRVDLYFDNSVKFTTTTTGIDVTGDTSTDTLTTSGNATIGADLTVTGNLTVNGTTTAINTTNLNVEDAVITLASGQATPVADIGLVFQRYSSPTASNYNPVIFWEEGTDRFVFGTTVETGSDNDISINTEFMTIEGATGHVGIGTANPTVPLNVYTTTDSTGILVQDNDSWATIVVQGGGGTNNRLELTNFGTDISGSIIRTTGTGHLRLAAGNTEAIRILGSNQQVGVGTDNPQDRLHVQGTVRAITPAASDWTFLGQNSAGTANSGLWYSSDNAQFLARNSSDALTVQLNSNGVSYLTGGAVGIGTTNPGKLLTLSRATEAANEQLEFRVVGGISNNNYDGIRWTQGASGGTFLAGQKVHYYSTGVVDMGFSLRNDTNVLYLKAGGNVGIGTDNPAYNLSVASSLNVFSAADLTAPKQQGHLLLAEGENGQADVTHWYAENSALSYGMRWYYDGNLSGTNTLRLYRHNNSFTGNEVVRFYRDSNNVAFTGNVGIGTTNPLFDLDVEGDVFFLGDLQGNGAQTGTITTRGSRLINTFMGSSPEDSHVAHPYLHNDLAEFRYRGGTVTVAGATLTSIDDMFRPNANHAYCVNSSIVGSTWTITLTDIPSNISYGNFIGITFGNQTFAPDTVKIEREVAGVWTTVYDSNVKTPYHWANASVSGTPITSIRFTLSGNTATNSIRINNIFAYDYNSEGMTNYFLPRSGGNVYGNVTVDNTLGTNTELTLNSKQDTYITLNSDTDNNATGQNLIYFQEGGVTQWAIQRTTGGSFQFNRSNPSTGVYIDSPISINSSGDVTIANDLNIGNGRLAQQFNDTTNLWTTINTGINAYEPTANELVIKNDAINTANSMASIFFKAGNTTAGGEINSARIAAVRENGFNTSLAFSTRSSSDGHTEKMRITSAGNVGIGTAPTWDAKLTIRSDDTSPDFTSATVSDISLYVTNSDTDYGTMFGTFGSGSGVLQQRRRAVATYYDFALNPYGGNVGIGTDTPSAKLHVENGSTGFTWTPNSRTAAIIEGNGAAGTTLSIVAPATGYSGIFFGDDGLETAGQLVYEHTTNAMRFMTTGSERMRLSDVGHLGIGTDSPGERLDVRGNLRVGGADAGPNYIAFRGTTGDQPGSYNHTYIGERIHTATEASELLIFKGNDAIASTGPDRIRLLAGDIVFDTYTTATSGTFETIGSSANANTRMIVKSSGNVGIGTTSPATALDVTGTVTADGLTVDGAAVFNDAGADVDFRVEGDTAAHLIFADASTDRVGIAENAPETRLHVSSSTAVTGLGNGGVVTIENTNGAAFDQRAEILFKNVTQVTSAISSSYTTFSGGQYGGDLILATKSISDAGIVQRMRITNNGDISFYEDTGTTPLFFWDASAEALGIGTSNPGRRLEISAVGVPQLRLTSPSSNTAIEMLTSSTTYSWLLGAQYNVSNAFEITPSTAVNGTTFSTPVAVFTQSGNVGIGTNNPGFKLHIANPTGADGSYTGGILIENSNTTSTGEAAIGFKNAGSTGSGSNMWLIGMNQDANFGFLYGTNFTDGNAKMSLSSDGNLIVGGADAAFTSGSGIEIQRSGTATLRLDSQTFATELRGKTDGTEIYQLSAGYLDLGTDNTTRIRITSGGNVGIGTNNPTERLHVNGDVIVKSNITYTSPDGLNQIVTRMLDTDTLSFSGNSGQLFSITDSLTGTIFSVNDISGIPSIEVDDSGTIRLAEVFGNVLIGTATDDGSNKLQLTGNSKITGNLEVTGTITGTFSGNITGTASNANLLDNLDSTQFLRSDVADIKTAGNLNFSDNVRATFGTDGDLEIFYDGFTSSFISTSNVRFRIPSGAGNNYQFQASSENLIYAEQGDGVYLYFNNSQKLATTNTGITVTGSVTASEISGTLNYTSSTGSVIQFSGTDFIKRLTSNGGARIGRDDILILGGGEASAIIESNTTHVNENVYIGAEGGIYFITSPDNWATSWAGRKEMVFNTSGDLSVPGALTATTKSFVIDHPTKPGMKLRHGSLEGPEDGVYVRGKLTDSNTIELPDYWTGLVDEDSITVQLTPIGGKSDLWVEDILNNTVIVGSDTRINCFYFVQAARKDVDKWNVEYEE